MQPPNFQESVNDVINWRNSMKNPKDIELYDAILKVINNKQVNTDTFSNESKDEKGKMAGRQEFWSNIGTHASAATQQRVENINNTPNFQPTFQRGGGINYYSDSKLDNVDEIIKLSEEANKIVVELDKNFVKYYNKQISFKIIMDKYYKLKELVNKINNNSTYLFPESILEKKIFMKNIDILIKFETIEEYRKIFIELKELFSEDSYYK